MAAEVIMRLTQYMVFRKIYGNLIKKLQAFRQLLAIVSVQFIVLENVLDLPRAVSSKIFSCLRRRYSFIRIKHIVVQIIISGHHDFFVNGIFFHRFHLCQIVDAEIGQFFLEHM